MSLPQLQIDLSNHRQLTCSSEKEDNSDYIRRDNFRLPYSTRRNNSRLVYSNEKAYLILEILLYDNLLSPFIKSHFLSKISSTRIIKLYVVHVDSSDPVVWWCQFYQIIGISTAFVAATIQNRMYCNNVTKYSMYYNNVTKYSMCCNNVTKYGMYDVNFIKISKNSKFIKPVIAIKSILVNSLSSRKYYFIVVLS